MSDWFTNPARTADDKHTIRLARYAAREELSEIAFWVCIVACLIAAVVRYWP